MDWFDFLTNKVAFGSIAGIIVAAAITCWRAGSFHPVNARLLRFFIAREEIEDPVIKKNLADQAALVSFRMTHGVRSQTLLDAQNLAAFSDKRNIPISLIGRAGWAFNLKKLEIVPKRIPNRAWPAGASVVLLFLIIGMIISAAVASTDDLLITLKGSETSFWLTSTEARKVRPIFGKKEKFGKDQCSSSQKPASPPGFKSTDPKTLCDIWADDSFDKYLAQEVPKQRRVFLMALGMLTWYTLMIFGTIRQWLAQIELNKILGKAETEKAEA
ncbi:hypothetical protein Xclt_08655 [Xanthomonas axonopodis pv. clitoriae]|uniref:Uncharacterized protein n=1 Tax=Xanthomonas axonopodis pv. clitoriae TaxID=487828 RepID=A0AB73PF48_9XANT|nr:DUF6216 family protein [Xanthomonas axonopodis]OOW84413.1 hypothetical protein Xclt_08655 [Xanthomonas axonopodis pv. clitoriae]